MYFNSTIAISPVPLISPPTPPTTPPTTSASPTKELSSEPGKLEDAIVELEKRFDDLVDLIEKSFVTSNIPLDKMLRSLKRIPVTLKRLLGDSFCDQSFKILKTKCIEELFIRLSYYWDYLNPGLLHFLVKQFGSESDKTLMMAYFNELRSFRSSVTIGEFLKIRPTETTTHILHQYKKITIKMSDDWEQKTLEDVEQFKIELCNECHLPQHFLTTTRMHHSSIAIIIYLPKEMDVTVDEMKDLFKKSEVTKVFLDNTCVIDWTKV